MNDMQLDTIPWYRQFWPWYLISIPLATIIACAIMISMAIRHKDALVVDNYYKQGLAINQTLEQQRAAAALGLRAEAKFEPDQGQLTLQLSANQHITTPSLKLYFVHATLADQDYMVKFARQSNGVYLAKMQMLKPGIWDLMLEPEDEAWRLDARLTLPAQHWLLKPDL